MAAAKEIAVQLANKVVKLRNELASEFQASMLQHKNTSPTGSGHAPTEEIVGGIVKSYKFTYEDGKSIADGTMSIEFGAGLFVDYDVSFLILTEAEGGIGGEYCFNIVEETSKLHTDAILNVYFTSYCAKIKRWIVAYDRIKCYFDDAIARNQIQAFFDGLDKSTLTTFWINTMRSFVRMLAMAKKENVEIGNLSRSQSYVIVPSGAIKIMGVGRFQCSNQNDLEDLRDFFNNTPFFGVSNSGEWSGFDFLLSSSIMTQAPSLWEPVVLKHPILLEQPKQVLASYEGIEIEMWGLSCNGRTKFANALYALMPQHRNVKTIQDFHSNAYKFTPDQLQVYNALHHEVNSYDNRIYIAIIQCSRNLIRHGGHHSKALSLNHEEWDDARKVREIKLLFGAFMSMAYSVSKVTVADWKAVIGKFLLKFPNKKQARLYQF